MSKEAVFIYTQTTCALIEAMGMFARNQQLATLGESIYYDKFDFDNLISKYDIDRNAVINLLMDGFPK